MTDDTDLRARMIDLWTDPAADPGARRDFLDHADPTTKAEAEALAALWADLDDALAGAPASRAEKARALAAARRAMGASRGRRWLQAAAVAVLAFGAGWGGGSRIAAPPQAHDGGAEFLLLIRGTVPDGSEPEVASAMRAWAEELDRNAHLTDARQLDERSAAWVGTDPGPGGRGPVVGGYFLVRAASRAQAEELARASPHLGYGGDTAVEVVPLLR